MVLQMYRIVIARRTSVAWPDGINRFIFELAKGFIKLGHEVFVVSGDFASTDKIRKNFDVADSVRLLSLSSKNELDKIGSIYLWYRNGRNIINRLYADLVIANTTLPALIEGILPFKFQTTSVMVAHEFAPFLVREKRRFYDLLSLSLCKKFSYSKFKYVIATTSEMREMLLNMTNIDEERIKVIPTCLDIKKLKPLQYSEREHALLHVGTDTYKNPLYSIVLFTQLALNDPNLKLYITGPVTEKIQSKIASLPSDIKMRIILLGYVPIDVLMELYTRVKVILVPSIYTCPVASPTIIEGLTSGTPIVGSASKDLIIDGYNSYRIALSDITKSIRVVQDLLNDENRWNEISKHARSHAYNFDPVAVAKEYIELLEEAKQ